MCEWLPHNGQWQVERWWIAWLVVWQGSPHRWAVRCGHLAQTYTHTHTLGIDRKSVIGLRTYTRLCGNKTFLFFRHLSLVFSLSCPPSVLLLSVCVPMLCSLVSVITREGEQIRAFTCQDVYMCEHTCFPHHRLTGLSTGDARFPSHRLEKNIQVCMSAENKHGRNL